MFYSIGWSCTHQLECAQNTYKYSTNTNNNEILVVICDKNNKKMVINGKGSNSRHK